MFAAITLSVMSIYDGYLSPFTAFTALAIFQRLESTLSLVPELVTDLFNAWVSIGRIEQFLASPEREDSTVDSDTICFKAAAIAWPSDEQVVPRYPTLRNLNLNFPKHELSIVAGPTGAGKNLLLAAAIGEADILLGSVHRPKPFDFPRESPGHWLIPKSTAFLAQTVWIENATIRDNILLSLPRDESRYERVLHACAFVQDLDIMEDEDMTEVGAQGISLSGGQRWRLSLPEGCTRGQKS